LRKLAPLPLQGSGLSSATPTGLAQYAQCPRRFYLDQLCGLANWPGEQRTGNFVGDFADGQAKELGTEVHELLAGKLSQASTAEVESLVAAFRESDLGRRAGKAQVVEREFDFVFAEEGVVIEGQIDLWFVEGGEVVVVDYKTDRVSTEAAASRARIYQTQVAVYRRVLGKLHPDLPVKAYLHFLRPGVVVEVAQELDAELLQRLALAEGFPTQPGEHCQRCAHLGAACDVTL
jgi:RecB family exonuclease